ncbi:ATP/GTP-binding protein (plasmid) [Streptomyces sp. SDT5-1]|uniref:ATP/GTP-binding protein n=1 Tax=Streptomyces sp. SDT5-1 TaxID=3406418 RepID=UPI003FD2DDC3
MLSRRRAGVRPAAAAVLVLTLGFLAQGVAVADGKPGGGGVDCPPDRISCDVTATGPEESKEHAPAHAGKPAGGKPSCSIDGEKVPCSRPGMGNFNAADSCYWEPTEPSAKSAKLATGLPEDWKPGDKGAFYNVSCPGDPLRGGLTFAEEAPGAGVDVQQLAEEAVSKLKLTGPDVASPRATGRYVVGVPMWLWVNPSATTFGPNSATASAGGVTVTATAKVSKIVWDMGDGKTAVCHGPGTPFKDTRGGAESPDCGHTYQQPSTHKAGAKYQVSATSHWNVTWQASTGQQGQIPTTRESNVAFTVGELQAVGD